MNIEENLLITSNEQDEIINNGNNFFEIIYEMDNIVYKKILSQISFIGEEEGKQLENIAFKYSIGDTNAIASAIYSKNLITSHIKRRIVAGIEMVLIHELAHHITYRYLNLTGHNLEFAIVTYCLQAMFMKDRRNFFRAYDIHEDKAYRFLSINPSEFDSFILNIEFNSFRELSNKASRLGHRIREKSVPMGLKIIEEEEELDSF